MYISRLELKNYRLFESLAVNFHPKLTVIVGTNGSGKTSVLEATAIAAGTLFTSFDQIPVSGIKKTDAHYKYYDMGSVIDVESQYPVEVRAYGKVNRNSSKSLEWARSLNSENGNTTIISAKDVRDISKEYQERVRKGDTELILPLVAYYGTGRLWDQHREKKSDVLKKNSRTNGYIDSIDGTANIKLMLKWFEKMTRISRHSVTASHELAAVQGAMEKCFSLLTGISDVRIRFNDDTLEIDVIYTDENSNKVRIPLNQLSDGYRCALSLIGDIAYRMATLNPQLLGDVLEKTDGVVMIDEIDLHLHPSWQQRVLEDLQIIFPNIQFIVTTHAPSVINSVRSENLVILNNKIVKEIQHEIYGDDVNSILSRVMEVKKRPVEVEKLFEKFYAHLEDGEFDLAEDILNKIADIRQNHDTEVAGCRVKLKLERIRRGNKK